jgi:class 3 adenylate cyclase/CheY-like chemotaxis protein
VTAAPISGGAGGTGGGHVLVVDDAAFNRRLLTRMLTGLGHTASEAADGREALALLREPAAGSAPVDVVLLDIVMPVMDGYDTLAALKEDATLQDLPVIVISDVDELASIVRCIRMGATDYLPKSVAPEILRARLEASLAQKRFHDLERETMAEQARLLTTIDRQRSELSRFLSPQVAALVSSDDGEGLLAGHRREITAMFCDLRNFTGFSEQAAPEDVLGFLRAYHTTMGRLIVAHEGTLEHFAGDGFMTFFNDPAMQADHAERAIRLAVAMRSSFSDLSAEWRARGFVLELGVGIATGDATLGRIGFDGRYDYGAVGRVIIEAARLSSEAAPGEILISGRTLEAAGASVDAVDAGERQLKGFSRPLPTFAVAGMRVGEAK